MRWLFIDEVYAFRYDAPAPRLLRTFMLTIFDIYDADEALSWPLMSCWRRDAWCDADGAKMPMVLFDAMPVKRRHYV